METLFVNILVLLALIIGSAYFSATETAFSAMNRIRMKNLANNGNHRAVLALRLAENYDKLLSTILIGNNIVNIAATSLATGLFLAWLGHIGVTVSTVVMTLLILIFGEIIPKSLAKETPERMAMFSSPLLKAIAWLLTPVNFLFSALKRLLLHCFTTGAKQGITEDELIMIVEEAEHDGGIGKQERELILSAIEFYDLQAADIFTPRIDVEAVSEDEDVAEINRLFRTTGFSRLPVYREDIDNIIGVINIKDFYQQVVEDGRPLAEIMKPILFTAANMKISVLLKKLQLNKNHIAVIVDEYGGTLGIVTLEDILEELVGEIWDEHDEVIRDINRIGENLYQVSGSASLNHFASQFSLIELPDVASVSGWVAYKLARIPAVGDSFRDGDLAVTVSKMEGRRVAEITVRVEPAAAAGEKH
ncbi:MAG: hemolysin family protein [Firmicutes bacterium]|nr:hemolysin family protein [Bacillota bacterium]